MILSTDVGKSVPPSGTAGTATSILNVTSHLLIGDINVNLDNLTHTFDGDLRISLSSPGGTSVVLSNQRGGSGNNLINTVFDDEAILAIGSGSAPFNGSFKPEGLLSAFDGVDAFGTWTLEIEDLQLGDSGRLGAWGLNIAGTEIASVPEPTTILLLGLGLVGLARHSRRSR